MSDGSCSSAALKNISPGRNITTKSGLGWNVRRSSPWPPSCDRCVRTCRAWSASSAWRVASSGASSAFRYASSGAFASMTTCLPPGRLMMTSGRIRRSLPSMRLLLLEVAVLEHAGELDDALQLQLAPAAAHAGPLERIHQPAGLGLQFLAGGVERGDALDQRGTVLHAAALGFPDFAVDVIERRPHRRQQVLDRLLARVDVGGGLIPRVAQPRLGEVEKGLVVGLQRLGAERLERFAEPRFGILIGLEPLGVDGAILFELGPQARVRRPAEPASRRARQGAGRSRERRSETRASQRFFHHSTHGVQAEKVDSPGSTRPPRLRKPESGFRQRPLSCCFDRWHNSRMNSSDLI